MDGRMLIICCVLIKVWASEYDRSHIDVFVDALCRCAPTILNICKQIIKQLNHHVFRGENGPYKKINAVF